MLETKFLAMRLKLKAQWKIIHDFKPIEYINNQFKSSLGVRVGGRVGLFTDWLAMLGLGCGGPGTPRISAAAQDLR